MEEDYGFCTHCGANISPGSERCPECGASLVKEEESASVRVYSSSSMRFFLIFIGLYAIFSIAEGIYMTVFNDAFVASMESIYGQDFDSYLSNIGMESKAQLADVFFKEGVVSIVDGAMVAVVFILCLRLRYWKAATVICIAASFLLLASFYFMTFEMMKSEALTMALQVLVGLMVARGIYINRKLFR